MSLRCPKIKCYVSCTAFKMLCEVVCVAGLLDE